MSTRRPDARRGGEEQLLRNTRNFNLLETQARVIMKRKGEVNDAVSIGNTKKCLSVG